MLVTENYKIAETRLQKLKEETFAFSTDIELTPANIAEKYTEEYRQTALQKLYDVPPIIDGGVQKNSKDDGKLISFIYILNRNMQRNIYTSESYFMLQ